MSDNLLSVLAGGAIGIIGGIAGPLCLEHNKRKAERSNLLSAIVSEIIALIEITERRKYVANLSALIAHSKATNTKPSFQFSVRRDPFPVYTANLSRIGILPEPLPSQIATFYLQSSAILEDIQDMRENKVPRTQEDSIHCLEEIVRLFDDSQLLGRKIIADASKHRFS